MSKKRLIVLIAAVSLLVLLCGTTVVIGLGIGRMLPAPTNSVDGSIDQPPPTATTTPTPGIERTPIPSPATPTSLPTKTATKESGSQQSTSQAEPDSHEGQASPLQLSTEQLLLQTNIPERDQRLLAMRLKQKGQEIPEVVRATPYDFQLGDTDTFWITDNPQTPTRQFEVTASLTYITSHSYWWVQEGFKVNQAGLEKSAERFERNTYPINRAFFGSEWSPGVDSDVRVHIFMGDVPGVAGYFSASNEYSNLAEPYSNEREMFFLNLKAISPGNDYFDSVLAHEFQHMIHWHQDRNEDTWVNEGMSELATFINDLGASNFVGAFTAVPDTQLTGWADQPGGALANYGGSFLFMAYFLQRFGEEMTQAVVAHPQNGIAGFDAVLAENGYNERFNDIFADYVVTNYLNNTEVGNGAWGYKQLSVNPVAPTERYSVFPVEQQTSVYQYGSDYIELTGRGDVTIEFTGSTQVQVVDNQAHSGRYQWYSHRGDHGNSQLTHAFDLRDVSTATLNYWTWYDIEADWDYGYVEISTDNGQSWDILQTPFSSTDNPSGNAYGPGYTGKSGEPASWVEESLDISAYAGGEVLIRFEYVTDDAVNRPGWTIDDISIPEIGFHDDVESGLNNWQPEGFVRIDNILPQRFLVQVVEIGDMISVRPLSLDQTNFGAETVTGLGDTVDRAVLIVNGLTPITSQPASYSYRFTQSDN